ncbi:putative quinol monooxygenase [Phycicoccus sp.]|mgnify:CR=1 FL=1|uniref:putative quinol monooxygenase n=1 Tax=Phycicoccus sp. TaxID=1902410 RepID=UPI002C071D80|nr:putative quinol monooxygenase [Phycicoccus sp.]HMM95065.1 putative quinol monooxygenase [Phycicoccus sp.]
MTTPTDDNRDLLTVIAYMKAAPGKEDELRDALQALVEPTTQEDGYVNYDLHESVEEPGRFFFYENWHSSEHLDAHLAAPHLTEFIARIPDLIDSDGLTVNRVRRIG